MKLNCGRGTKEPMLEWEVLHSKHSGIGKKMSRWCNILNFYYYNSIYWTCCFMCSASQWMQALLMVPPSTRYFLNKTRWIHPSGSAADSPVAQICEWELGRVWIGAGQSCPGQAFIHGIRFWTPEPGCICLAWLHPNMPLMPKTTTKYTCASQGSSREREIVIGDSLRA
jgi:hypothetical protein